ncbi:MAG: 3-oxoacyl-[acyl-carrier-protein] reductase [Calditrichia bacterium]
MEITLKGKTAIITGATSGIGEATARRFAEMECRLFLTGRNSEKLKELKEELEKKTDTAFLAGDITNTHFREKLIEAAVKKYGQLDILVNAAGIIATGTIENTSLEDFDYMMDINLRSVFHLIQLAIPYLEKRSGNIVNVSSVTGVRAFPGILAYCVSKAGVDQLTHAAALELAPKGIRINAVNPGVVVTNLHKAGGMNDEAYQKFLEHSKTTHPLGRVGKPEEIADLIAFLASDNAGWITGVSYSIDGGRHQTCAR